ncbi:MAG TPA: GDYXXLXY domain-containing protein [Kiritimatiellia bacterium]
MKKIRLILFVLLAVGQLLVPAGMIARWQHTLVHGDSFKFLTAPVDPYDAFRGRYVALKLDAETVDVPTNVEFRTRAVVYGTVSVDTNGFASLTDLSTTKPDAPAIRCRIKYVDGGKAYLDLPIDRLYMNEKLAPEAEAAYRENSLQTNHVAYVTVRILDGDAVVEDLYINDTPIREYLEQRP